jgi:hypothetical protein
MPAPSARLVALITLEAARDHTDAGKDRSWDSRLGGGITAIATSIATSSA